MNDRPDWLETAVAEHRVVPSPWRQSQPTDIVTGDIVVVGAMDGFEVPDRLVAVLEVDADRRCFLGVLVTNEIPLATADDVILLPEDTDLPYQVAAMTQLAGFLWFVQVAERVGVLTDTAAAAVAASRAGFENPFQRSRRGAPLQESRWDYRWLPLEVEATHMRTLTEDCTVRRRNPLIGMPFLDPEYLTASRPEALISERESGWPPNRTRGFSPSCGAWAIQNLSNQEMRAYGQLVRITCRPASPLSLGNASGIDRPRVHSIEDELLQLTIRDGLQEAPFVKILSPTKGDRILRPGNECLSEIVYIAA